MLTDVKYTRHWQLGLKKNFQDLVVKPPIFTTQKMKFSVKDYLINVSKLTVYVDIFTFTKYIIHGNVHFLCTDLCK